MLGVPNNNSGSVVSFDVIAEQFDDSAAAVSDSRAKTGRFSAFLRSAALATWRVVYSFRGFRVTGFIVLAFLFSFAFFGIENAYGRNTTFNASVVNSTFIPGLTADPTGLFYIDALFASVSLLTSTGLQTFDFAQWTLASQIIALFEMAIGSLQIASCIPLVIRIGLTKKHGGFGTTRRPEYRGLVLVFAVIMGYYVFFAFINGAFFMVYNALTPELAQIYTSASPPVNPWFGGFFMAFSAFSNCGFAPLTSGAVPFATFPGWQIWQSVLMLMGNVAFPGALCLLLYCMHWLGFERLFHFPLRTILRNPRAFYQMLFPMHYVFYLAVLWSSMYLVSFALCMGLEWFNAMVALSPGQKLTASIFTVVASRTTGLNVLIVSSFKSAFLVLQLVVFVISSSPNFLAMRATSSSASTKSVEEYTKELLINVVAGITFCWILLLVFENENPYAQAFPVLFEIASAFGTVGLSLGFGNSPTSLSGCFSVVGKLLIIIIMSVGYHRSMPLNIDPVVRKLNPPKNSHVIAVEVPTIRKVFETRTRKSFLLNRRRSFDIAAPSDSQANLPFEHFLFIEEQEK